MHILITRPVQDAEPFSARVEELGCKVTVAPLMEIVSEPIRADALRGASALVATSRNALTALAVSPALTDAVKLPLFVVGPGTAAAARAMGFATIFEGEGKAEDLVPLLVSKKEWGGRLIHLRGDVVAFDLEGALSESSVNIVPLLSYRAVTADTLPTPVIKALQTGGIDVVTLMSPRTARTWAKLVATLSPPVQLSGVTYLCLSERVREALGPLGKDSKVWVPGHPNIEEMLALVKRLAANSKAE